MRKATLIITSLLLAAPAAAHAKAGVEFKTYPEKEKVGSSIKFVVMAFREPRGGAPQPVLGAHPLVTFRSRSGAVIRVRASRTGPNGIAHGSVRFTDKGPWTTEMHMRGVHIGSELSAPIRVGTGLTQVIPAADSTHSRPAATTSGFPWVWVFSLGAIGSALLVLVMRRRGRWGAA
jgi:hypothetical protein